MSSRQPCNALDSTAMQLHVVMVPYPGQGQINPMMQFAELLTAKQDSSDIMVTLVHNKYNHDRIQKARAVTSIECSPSPDAHAHPRNKLHLTWVDNGLPPDFDYSYATRSQRRLATLHMKEPLKKLLQNLNRKRPPVSCVVFGTFGSWAHSAAAEVGIPTVMFWTQSATLFSIYYHLPLLLASGFFPYNKKSLSGGNEDHIETCDLVTCIPGLQPLHPSSFPTVLHVDRFPDDPSLAIVQEHLSVVGSCDGVIINSFEEIEGDICQALQQELPHSISLVGPILPLAALEGDDANDKLIAAKLPLETSDCIKWLDSKQRQSVLYISFGTMFSPSADELAAIAIGIQSLKQPFLWVIRPNLASQNVCDMQPNGFVEDTKEYGMIIPWAPQVEVLSHTSVGAFLTHCGWNSVLESLSVGMPMICFPICLDQPTNSAQVCDMWKVGMALKGQDDVLGKVNSEDVAKVVRAVLHEQEGLEMRERAGKLRDAARRAVQVQGSSYAHIEEFLQGVRSHAQLANAPAIPDHAKS